MEKANIDIESPRLEFFLDKSRDYLVSTITLIIAVCVVAFAFAYPLPVGEEILIISGGFLFIIYALKSYRNFLQKTSTPVLTVDESGISEQFENAPRSIRWQDIEKLDIDYERNNGLLQPLLIVAYLNNGEKRFVIYPDRLKIKFEELYAILQGRLDAYRRANLG